ncbi:MAG: protein-L-isoaspartate O-methyltransferase family protein [Qingshengfaniella sp.]
MPDYALRREMMVDTQVRPSDVTKYTVIDAMLQVPREMFVPQALAEAAYVGENLSLGEGRVLLEPRTLAKMLDALNPGPTDLVLDLGCGYGYSSAVIARMAEAVVAVEENDAMRAEAEAILADQGIHNVAVLGGPLAEGAPQHGPYDLVIIEGAVERMTDAVLSQVKDGGRIAAIFAEGRLGVVRIGYKIDGDVSWRFAFNAGAPVLAGFQQPAAFAL